jgi:hypothetical protein
MGEQRRALIRSHRAPITAVALYDLAGQGRTFVTSAAMIPYQRTPPPLVARLAFATLRWAMGPAMWFLQRFKLEGRVFRMMRERQLRELRDKNPFAGYRPNEHDVFVVTYVKSGTNWMMQVAHQLLFHGGGDYDHIHSVVPWPDTALMVPMANYAIPIEDPRVWMASPEGKRVIKTHFRWEDVPYSPTAKYLIVIRDPKDVFVSSYHFFVKDGPFSFTNLSVSEWLELFLSDQFVMGGSWGVTTAGYWAQRDKPNVMVCSFKEMRRDLEGSVRQVAAFLGVDDSPAVIRRVVELSSFEYMKGIDHKFDTGKFLQIGKPAAMMRQGGEGGSSALLTPEQRRRIDEHFIAELKQLGSDFPYAEFCRVSPGVSTGEPDAAVIARASADR